MDVLMVSRSTGRPSEGRCGLHASPSQSSSNRNAAPSHVAAPPGLIGRFAAPALPGTSKRFTKHGAGLALGSSERAVLARQATPVVEPTTPAVPPDTSATAAISDEDIFNF